VSLAEVAYYFHVGRNRNWRTSITPPPMSPPTRLAFIFSRSVGEDTRRDTTQSRNPGANRSIWSSSLLSTFVFDPSGTWQ
jgi:hypothetical protein